MQGDFSFLGKRLAVKSHTGAWIFQLSAVLLTKGVRRKQKSP